MPRRLKLEFACNRMQSPLEELARDRRTHRRPGGTSPEAVLPIARVRAFAWHRRRHRPAAIQEPRHPCGILERERYLVSFARTLRPHTQSCQREGGPSRIREG